jgi:hypothetical protein
MNISVDLEHYLDLVVRDEMFNRLEAAGIDNWDGYGEADISSSSLNEFRESIREELFKTKVV